jgi:hypothetical protein
MLCKSKREIHMLLKTVQELIYKIGSCFGVRVQPQSVHKEVRIDPKLNYFAHAIRNHQLSLFAVLAPAGIRTLVVPIVDRNWQACIEKRLLHIVDEAADNMFITCLLTSRFTLDGQPLAANHDPNALRDATLRLQMPGLRGGGRRSESKSDLAQLSHAELRTEAKAMGINVRIGRAWRPKEDIIEEMMTKDAQSQKGLAQALPGNERRFSFSLGSGSSHAVIDLDTDEGSETKRDKTRKQDKARKKTAAYKALEKKRKATPAYKAIDKNRKATPAYKAIDKNRKATPAYKAIDKNRKATPAYKAIDKDRKATPHYKALARRIDSDRKATPA